MIVAPLRRLPAICSASPTHTHHHALFRTRSSHHHRALLCDSRDAHGSPDVLAANSFLVVYFFAEYLPELRFNRTARGAAHAVTKFINPDGELREAQRGFDQAATVGNRIRLAQALLGKGDTPGAAAQFRECAQGALTKDPDVLYGLADAEFACGNAPAAATAMQTLF